MATKIFTVTIEEEKLLVDAPDEMLTQLEAQFINIIEEINMMNVGAQLKVTSVEEQS